MNNIQKDASAKKSRLAYGIAVIICSAAVVILALLQLLGVFPDAALCYIPLMGIIMILQACNFWKGQRWVAVVNLCAAVFVLLCYAAVLILK